MSLSAAQVDRFHDEGDLQIDGLLRQEDLNPVIYEFEMIIDRRARQMYADGHLTQLHEREPFERRIGLLAAEHHPIARDLGPNRVLGCAMFNLMCNPRLLDALDSILGPEILAHPTQVVRPRIRDRDLSADRRRTTDRTPIHQDAGVLRPDVDETLLITAWIPLTRADEENGCLAVIPGSHRYGVRRHDPHSIPDEELPPGDLRPLPVDPGSVIFFTHLVCHCGLPHQSDRVRWSIDLRYQDPAQPTGNPVFEGSIVRSRSNPQSELTYPQWVSQWKRQLVHDNPWPPIPRWPEAK